MSRDELRALQESRFLATVARGWEIPFFQRHWANAGMEPGDIRTLDDLQKIPPYTVHDIRESIERNPPFGNFMGISPEDGKRMPLVLQTSGGTTGLPRPMLYAPQDRETMAIPGGRRFALHGIRPGDMVLVTYALGLSNGGLAPREALWRYTGAVPVMTGSGATTPTRRQIEIVKAWGVHVILGFPAYLRHMAFVARDEMRIDVKTLGIRHVFPEAVGAAVVEDARTNGEYFCFVDRIGEAGTDELTVMVEVPDAAADRAAVKSDLERRMKEVLGVRVRVEVASTGALDEFTGTSRTSKVKRIMDRRSRSTS